MFTSDRSIRLYEIIGDFLERILQKPSKAPEIANQVLSVTLLKARVLGDILGVHFQRTVINFYLLEIKFTFVFCRILLISSNFCR